MFHLPANGRVRGSRNLVLAVVAVALVVAGPSAFVTTSMADSAGSGQPPWLDAHQPISARVSALLGAMTLPEKVGQMDQQLVTTLTDTDGTRCGDNGFNLPNPTCMQKVLID